MYEFDADGSAALDRLIKPALWLFLVILVVVPSLIILSLTQINQRSAVFEIKAANGLALALAGKPRDFIVAAFVEAGFENVHLASDAELAQADSKEGAWVPIYTADGLRQGGIAFTLLQPGTEVFVSTIGYKAPIALSGLLVLLIYVVRISRRARAVDIQRVRTQQMNQSDGLVSKLANRRCFDKRLHDALKNAHSTQSPLALYFVDIDHLKKVNDTHGHGIGDALIQQIGSHLKMMADEGDLVARLAGDEFAVIKLNPGSTAAAMAFAHEIVQELNTDMMIEGLSLRTSVSVGIALATGDEHLDRAGFCRNADMALYASKRAGRSRATLFSNDTVGMVEGPATSTREPG